MFNVKIAILLRFTDFMKNHDIYCRNLVEIQSLYLKNTNSDKY